MTRQRRLSGRPLPALDLASRRVAVDPGGDAHTTATMTNQGAVSGTYFFEVLGPLKEWASINPPRTTIAPGAEASVHLGFRIPTASRVAPGDWPFGVRCSSEADMKPIGDHRGHYRGPTREKGKARSFGPVPPRKVDRPIRRQRAQRRKLAGTGAPDRRGG